MAERVLSKLLARTHAVMEEWQLDQSPSLDRVSQWQRKRLSDVLQPLVEKHTLTFAQRMVHKTMSTLRGFHVSSSWETGLACSMAEDWF